MEAIEEARSGKYTGTIDTSSMENFINLANRQMLYFLIYKIKR